MTSRSNFPKPALLYARRVIAVNHTSMRQFAKVRIGVVVVGGAWMFVILRVAACFSRGGGASLGKPHLSQPL